jgi:hypothetical protein
MKTFADLLTQTRSALAEVESALDMFNDLETDQSVFEVALPLINAQGELKEAQRILAHEVEMKPRLAAIKAGRSA